MTYIYILVIDIFSKQLCFMGLVPRSLGIPHEVGPSKYMLSFPTWLPSLASQCCFPVLLPNWASHLGYAINHGLEITAVASQRGLPALLPSLAFPACLPSLAMPLVTASKLPLLPPSVSSKRSLPSLAMPSLRPRIYHRCFPTWLPSFASQLAFPAVPPNLDYEL
jgi:hypothetical protein